MKPLVLGIALVCASSAGAQGPSWFTVVGDPGDPRVDTVEVDAASAVAFESMRLVRLRVNRAHPRTGYDGQPYQSYQSTAAVDCAGMRAWHRSLSLYGEPLWRGPARALESREGAEGYPVAFAEMASNPRERLLRAACRAELRAR